MANALKTAASENRTGNAVIHQLLHGYAEGHRLLESSVDVPEDLTRLVLRLSDLSGSKVSTGFDEYLTGYPLKSLRAYALAKSWYAAEMPRPGCVWTHTLVIPEEIMPRLVRLDALRVLFRRPGENSPRSAYGKPLVLNEEGDENPKGVIENDILQNVLAAHYGNVDAPVLLAARSSKEFEDLVFAVWSQKWPDLRMAFTFCTGALSARFFEKRPFDIQCIPAGSSRGVLLDLVEAGVSEPAVVNPSPIKAAPWIVAAATDVCYAGGSLRNFLWFVAGHSNKRKDFAGFVSVYDALQTQSELSDLLSLVAEVFPASRDGSHLKNLLFGEKRESGVLSLPRFEERDVLLAIGTTNEYQSFDADILRLSERSAVLCVNAPDTASWLVGELFRSTLNPLGEEILAGIISSMEPEVARRVTSRQPQFLPALFEAKPSLACSSQLWEAGGDKRRELFEAVAKHEDLPSSVIKGIVRALLESNSDGLMRRALERWGKDAVFETLDWMAEHAGAISDSCREALIAHVMDVADWAEHKSIESFTSYRTVVSLVASQVATISKKNSGVWLRNFQKLHDSGKDADVTYTCAFLLALGLQNSPPLPLDLIGASFERVHEAARTQRLSDNAWYIVEPFVPELSWLSNWDKCERLRRGLVGAFVRYQWPFSELGSRIRDTDLQREIGRSARKVEGGEGFARQVSPYR
jgi:hypothetical protein